APASLEHGDDRRQRLERAQHGRGVVRRDDDGEALARVAVPARIACRRTPERCRDLLEQPPRPVDQQPALRVRLVRAVERREQLRLLLRPDARHLAQPAGRGGLAELRRGPYSERARDLHRLPCADPEIASEPDEIGLHLALELLELGDLAGLDELLQAALDPPTDPAELANAT